MNTNNSKTKLEKSLVINLLDQAKRAEIRRRFEKSSASQQKTFLMMTGKWDKLYVARANSDMKLLINKAKLLIENIKSKSKGQK